MSPIYAAVRVGTAADIPFIMETERLPGYDRFVGYSDEARHRAELADPASAYLIGARVDDDRISRGFAILRQLDDPSGNVLLRRIAVAEPGSGFGGPFLHALQAWVFARAGTHRLWLDVFEDNARARRAYLRVGFREDGLLRGAYVRPDGRRVTQVLMSILRPEWEAGRSAVPFTGS